MPRFGRKAARALVVPSAPPLAVSLIVLLVSFATTAAATAQTASLRGRVVDASNEPMEGVNVVLLAPNSDTYGTATTDGFYLVTRIPAGTYTLSVSFVGFTSLTDTLTLAADQNVMRNFTLVEDPEVLGAVLVESDRTASREFEAGLRTIRGSDVELLPGASLSADLGTFLTTEAGVVTVADRGGQLYVRGSTPSQNIFLLDGMRIYQPLHLLNMFSIYPAEIVAFADVFSSGYGAYYGGRTGAVVDVNTRNGNKESVVGSASVSPFLGSIHLEIPVIENRVSLLASGRQSLISGYGDVVTGQDLPYRYGDRFIKLHAFLSETANFAVTALRSNDRGNLAGDSDLGREISWSNEAYGANYFYLSPDLPVLTEITLSSTRFEMEKRSEGETQQSSNLSGFEGSFNFGYLLGSYQVHFGIFANTTKFRYALGTLPGDRVAEFVTEGGIFIEGRFRPARGWHVAPGVRVQTFPSRGQSYLEPRVRATVPLGFLPGATSLAGAIGIYHQGLIGLTDDRTVSEVFTAWAPSEVGEPIPRSVHYSVGVSSDLGRLSLSVEGYRRSVENVGFPELGSRLTSRSDLETVNGFSRGIDFAAEYRRRSMFFRATYGLARTRYDTGSLEFSPPHDRRHSLSLATQYHWRAYRFSALWQYGSGLPFTKVNGVFDRIPVDRDVGTDPGVPELLFGESFGGRLPAYHRLDVSVERDIRISTRTLLTMQASVVNAYDRRNWFDLDYDSLQRLNQLPFVPTAAVRVRF